VSGRQTVLVATRSPPLKWKSGARPGEVIVTAASDASDRAYSELGLELLLFSVQSPTNIGLIMRVAEAYCFTVSIFDPHRVLGDPEKLKTIEDFACGSLPRRSFVLLSDQAAVERRRAGRRLIVTSILPGACSLPTFRFQAGDIIALGNEYDGLPDELSRKADLKLHIPMPKTWIPKPASWYPIDPTRNAVAHEGTPNLNVAMSAGIICYSAYTSWTALHQRAGANPE
jgi:tRNA G18 (ribose-2'-O)-methylase SpoU